MIRAKELFTWNPSFLAYKEREYASEDESVRDPNNNEEGQIPPNDEVFKDEPISDDDGVPETVFESNTSPQKRANGDSHSKYPFGFYALLKEKKMTLVIWRVNATSAGIITNVVNSPGDASVASFSEQVGHQFNNTGGLVLDIMEGFIKVVVYAPQLSSGKKNLWDYLLTILGRWNGEVIVMGDFNEVRSNNERRGSCFHPYSARHFDRFISNLGLIDIPLEGYAFTWSHHSASKMSKLDRFLISDGVFSLFSSIMAVCLDRHLSDHRPILLREVHVDFGPIPFRFYHSWFDHVRFDEMIKSSWVSFSIV
nr:RNA-directed DNA polymerase, eukaryota [Tanacetum cinerariifolium]